jgi:hypothetical protein
MSMPVSSVFLQEAGIRSSGVKESLPNIGYASSLVKLNKI